MKERNPYCLLAFAIVLIWALWNYNVSLKLLAGLYDILLPFVIGGCMALMQSVTHRIGTEVTSLVERYENTLPELTKEVSEYESEVNGYLAEMGFTL